MTSGGRRPLTVVCPMRTFGAFVVCEPPRPTVTRTKALTRAGPGAVAERPDRAEPDAFATPAAALADAGKPETASAG